LATALGETVYRQSGYIDETEYLFLRDGLTSSQPAMDIIPFNETYRQSILELDNDTTGEKRDVLLKAHLRDTRLVVEHGMLVGCYFPTLGEGFILATNRLAGLTLLNLKHKHVTRTVVPADNKVAVDFLVNNGFEGYQRCMRMRLGKPLSSWKPQHIFSRGGGNIG
jgi:hypothetical protein